MVIRCPSQLIFFSHESKIHDGHDDILQFLTYNPMEKGIKGFSLVHLLKDPFIQMNERFFLETTNRIEPNL